MSTARPRVLLIEDDLSLQQFVALALDEFEIELLAVSTVEDGLAALARGPVALILTDLMLPGRSGYDLIDALAADPALGGGAPLVVFSAGLNLQARQRLDRPEVWRLLPKPCSLAELEACVGDALALRPQAAGTAGAAGAPTAAGAAGAPAAPAAADAAADPSAAAIADHFGGDAALYHAFRASCLAQFRADAAEGDGAVAAADVQALRRLAHSLKSVLATLGHPQASECARALEQACERADRDAAVPHWQALRAQLEMLGSNR